MNNLNKSSKVKVIAENGESLSVKLIKSRLLLNIKMAASVMSLVSFSDVSTVIAEIFCLNFSA